ncbi:MAG: hypothetical protein AAFU64_07990 [Bacteroidota bacterium]
MMKNQFMLLALLILLVAACQEGGNSSNESSDSEEEVSMAAEAELSGADILAFGPDNVLFVGDSKNAKLMAIQTEAEEQKDPIPFNLEGFDVLVGEKLNLAPRDIIIKDMKIHPLSQEAYVSIKMGHQPEAASVIAIVNPGNSDIRLLEVTEENSSHLSLNNPASADVVFWKETPASALSITDIDYHDGFVYVAGLTNSEFASTLRKIAYPFNDDQVAVNSIEIYHAVHTQNETRAPIRTMLFDEIDGESTLIASYTCTPLVTIPTAEIEDGANIKGKTIAELGYGNAPIDMVTLNTQGADGAMVKNLLVTHVNRGGSLIPFESLVQSTKGKGLAGTQAMAPTGIEGMVELPTANIMQIDYQNQMMLGVVRRNIQTGDIDLVSEMTGVYLRLSDFISEYDFPDYRYPEEQAFTKSYHDQAKQMEGYPELTSEEMGR